MCRKWAEECIAKDPTYFSKIAGSQSPEFLYIGCSDSRAHVRTPSHPLSSVEALIKIAVHTRLLFRHWQSEFAMRIFVWRCLTLSMLLIEGSNGHACLSEIPAHRVPQEATDSVSAAQLCSCHSILHRHFILSWPLTFVHACAQPAAMFSMAPGEVFVQRNVGNLVSVKDLNCMSCLEYTIDHLKVKHILVTGHYNCGAPLFSSSNPSKPRHCM